jgi:hypothetical protein
MFRTRLDLLALDEPGMWAVDSPLVWFDPTFGLITVDAGEMTDLASVPMIFRNVLDVNGRSRRPAVLHDHVYRIGHTDAGVKLSRAQCDDLLYRALIAEGASAIVARTYWSGVRMGGWVPWNKYRKDDVRAA